VRASHSALLRERASRPYRSSGRLAWHFARGKLRHDPYFVAVVERGLLPREGRLLDVGCGQGLLLAMVCAARKLHASGTWPADWPPPPERLVLSGIELDSRRVEIARRALGELDPAIEVTRGDMRDAAFPRCSAMTLIDVLFYLDARSQDRLLEKAARALAPGGVLIMREADAAAGTRFAVTRWSGHLDSFLRGGCRRARHYRSAGDWQSALERLGFTVQLAPMSQGTPFSNILFVARLR
jgi:SAM-dependent methyltransferase